MNDHVTSLIRTWVPVAIGAFITWLASTADILVPEDAEAGLVAGITGVVIAIYYAVVRWLESKNPIFGILIGSRKQPEYVAPPAA